MSDNMTLAVGNGSRRMTYVELVRARSMSATGEAADLRKRADEERGRANEAARRLADKDATITGLVAQQQELRREVETLTELLAARRSWWRRVFGRTQ